MNSFDRPIPESDNQEVNAILQRDSLVEAKYLLEILGLNKQEKPQSSEQTNQPDVDKINSDSENK
jgi:hypothetical protein